MSEVGQSIIGRVVIISQKSIATHHKQQQDITTRYNNKRNTI